MFLQVPVGFEFFFAVGTVEPLAIAFAVDSPQVFLHVPVGFEFFVAVGTLEPLVMFVIYVYFPFAFGHFFQLCGLFD